MSGPALSGPAPAFQRARGELMVAVKPVEGETMLRGLRQSGCLRARFPRRIVPGWLDVVMLNTSGGIAAGDQLTVRCDVEAGARASFAAQAAERFYRRAAGDGPALVSNAIDVGAAGFAEWLPQETILFDGCALDRRLEVSLAASARFLGVETLVFGRAAMGEQVRAAWVRDRIRVRRAGTLLLHDAIRLDGAVQAALDRPAIAGRKQAVATILFVAEEAEDRLVAVRAALGAATGDAEASASAWNGMLVVRIVAPGGAALRRTIIAALSMLRDDRPLPRMWCC